MFHGFVETKCNFKNLLQEIIIHVHCVNELHIFHCDILALFTFRPFRVNHSLLVLLLMLSGSSQYPHSVEGMWAHAVNIHNPLCVCVCVFVGYIYWNP